MSPRRWLHQWPIALRIFVLVLAVLQVVAPSWHVCGLSGHAARCAEPHVMAVSDEPMRPVICFCRDLKETAAERAARLWPTKANSAPPKHDPSFCLALLMQTMPGEMALVSLPPLVLQDVSADLPYPTQESAIVRPRDLIPGRGPPLNL